MIESGKELVNEARGVMQLKPGSGRAIEYSPGVDSVDFRVSVEFSNPFHPTFSPWNYGVKFRDDGQKYQMFVLDHNGDLLYIRGDGPELEIVSSMPVPTMFTAGGIRNKMTLLVIADRAYVLVDGILTGIFTVEDTADSGEVSLVTDIYNQTVVVGAQTEFFDLVINSAGLIGSSGPGQLVRSQPGEIAVGEPSLLTSEGYARVTFVSPINAFSGDYSYGLLFRNEVTGIDNWLVFDDSKKWRHIRRSTTGAESVLSSGTASELKTGAGDANSFEFLSTGQENKIYLNGKLLTNLGFAPEDLPFTIAPMAAFEPTHQTGGMATEYRDFAVWSVAR